MTPSSGRRDWLVTLAVGLLSLLPRLYASLAWSREPVWDGHYYDFGARRIAEGFGYSDDVVIHGVQVWHPWCHYPVGYSGFLAALYAVFGSGQYVAPVANAVIGALIVMVTHRIALHWLTRPRALVAAVLCGINLELIFYSPLVMTELLATLGPLLAIWLALVFRRKRPWQGAALSGVLLGLSTLVHPQTIVMAPVLGFAVNRGPTTRWAHTLAAVVIVTASALFVVAPWTYRNCRVMDGCAFVSTNGGWNLAIGSFPRATGRFETLRASDGCEVVTGQVQQDRCWGSLGLKFIRSDPGRWLGLIPAKLGYCFDHASFPVEYLRQADPQAWPEPVRVWWRGALSGMLRLLLSLAAFGLIAWSVRSRRGLVVETALRSGVAGLVAYAWFADIPIFWPLALAIIVTGLIPRRSAPELGPVGIIIVASFLVFVLTHVVFFGEDRYHVPLVPMMCLLAAASFRGPGKRCLKIPQR
jgi:4-amino-4-deoxy-L-arabinose transferase-like glycosyltransferase